MEIELTDANFKKEVLESELPCLVDFWAKWCGPCSIISPIVEQLAKQYEGKLKVCKLNVDEAPDIASNYSIMGIPTLIIFKNGNPIDRIVGVTPKEKIESKINAVLEKN